MHFSPVAFYLTIIVPCLALPNIFKRCKIDDDKCLKSSVEYAISNLGNGLEELKIGPLDPLVLPAIEVQAIPGPISLYQKYSNGMYRNFTQLKVVQFKVDLDKCQMYLEAFLPTIFFSGDYSIKGRLFLLEIDSDGTVTGTSTNSTLFANMTCVKYQQNNNQHIKVTDLQANFVWGEILIHFGDVFKGNDKLNEEFDKSVNENIAAFLEILKEDEMEILGALIKDYANKVFSTYSVSEIFEMS
ncbi:hypothetical protein PPYR_12719 [Photinus pyralis]|uniref:Hemolymph juvenile hormone-binding protein n=1 Tax=Photinus pyralis TaxID=7054 RepID=A0A1Y1LWW5_PHOPY|nr:uncharacterized protein LOC116178663 [Photinus pyralis]KAB0793099.1 hypothetical protein PPYR_12719 [Photinus pyralis]